MRNVKRQLKDLLLSQKDERGIRQVLESEGIELLRGFTLGQLAYIEYECDREKYEILKLADDINEILKF